jgi:titin
MRRIACLAIALLLTEALAGGFASAAWSAPIVPNAPTIGGVTAGDGAASVAFTAGDDGGSPVAHFDATCSSSTGGASGTANAATSPILVGGLTNDQTYACSVTATNAIGTSVPSGLSLTFVPTATSATSPQPPFITDAIASAGAGSVAFTPADNGGSPVLQYDATCTSLNSASSASATASASPIVVKGLTNGDTYTCTVTATNLFGTSASSTTSNRFKPMPVTGAPDPPSIGLAAAGDGAATVTFASGNPGAGPILGFRALCQSTDAGLDGSADSGRSPIVVSGLTDGKRYTCAVLAWNAFGTSALSDPSNTVIPSARVGAAPSAPAKPSAVPGMGRVSVAWTTPSTAGSSPITSYVITPYLAGHPQAPHVFNTSALADVVTGLTNAKTYRFKVAATNGAGTGPASVLTNTVTVGAPTAPTAVKATQVANGSLVVSFIAPADNGATISNYLASCTSSNGGVAKSKAGKSSPITVAGVSAGKTYHCSVRATNSRGTGPTSTKSGPVTA